MDELWPVKQKGMYARSVDIKKHHEVMTQLLLRLSCCASSKNSNSDLQSRLRSFLSIFQHQRKQLRQERASTLLSYFPKQKEKNSRDRGSGQESRKEKPTTSKPRLFYLRKNARFHDGNFAAYFGKRARSYKDNWAFLVAVFHALANALCCRALPIEHGK